MTGFGDSVLETDRFVLSVELRSVNSRSIKLGSKIPEEVSFLQAILEDRVRRRVARGSVALTVRFEPRGAADLYDIDDALLRKYLSEIEDLGHQLGKNADVPLIEALKLPGVIHVRETMIPERDEILPAVERALDTALDRLLEMRAREGAHLEKDVRERSARLVQLLEQIDKEAPLAIENHRSRLDQRLRQILGERENLLTTEDILKEVAILAERSDITEEIARMRSHLDQFHAALDSESAVGRRLEFIVQEMFREANTMGSKSSSLALSQLVVELKAEVDRVKEQVANIE